MITKDQIEGLSKYYRIDGFTIMREYLQLVFLSYLYQKKEAKRVYFKGGTAIRLLFGSPRFSEDLDFSTFLNKKQMIGVVKELEKLIQQELPKFSISLLYSGRETTRFRIRYRPDDFKYPLVVRLDFHHVKKVGKVLVSPLLTKFPIVIFPLITHLSPEEILTEKQNALINRGKGRDFFDVWYLREKGIILKKKINKEAVLKKIRNINQSSLKRDLAPFLPKSQRPIIDILKNKLINLYESKE